MENKLQSTPVKADLRSSREMIKATHPHIVFNSILVFKVDMFRADGSFQIDF